MAPRRGVSVAVMARCAAVIVLVASGCRLGAIPSAAPTTEPTRAPDPSVDQATSLPSQTPPTSSHEPSTAPTEASPPAEGFEFVRWLSRDVTFYSEPGGGEWVGSSNDYEAAAVVGRTTVDGLEWIRVQHGAGYPGHFVSHGWAPAWVDGLGQTYEPFVPQCPEHAPTLADVGGMPLLSLSCFGSQTLTFSPVQVRDEGAELSERMDGQPTWLAEGGGLVAHWFPGWQELGSIHVYADPAADFQVPQHTWIELSGQFDHPAAQSCSMTSSLLEILDVANDAESVSLCRGRFVVTGVRELSGAEIPTRPPQAAPGPSPDSSVDVAVRSFDGPFSTRISPSVVWTGAEMIVWGGTDWSEDRNPAARANGAAYDPARSTWREIPDGPLSRRAGHMAAWTGTEMLVWGGYREDGPIFGDGAAYDPTSDTWRPISEGPFRASYETDSVWTGTEWWVAVTRQDRINMAAYDPSTDSWRRLPSPNGRGGDGTDLVWTGSEVLFKNSNTDLFRIKPGDAEWTAEPIDFYGPLVWTGDLLIGSRHENLATDVFDWEPWSYPVAWDPVTSSAVDIPNPPTSVGDSWWTGDYLAFFEEGLALDLEAGEWLNLDLAEEPQWFGYRSDAAAVWAGDRLIVWGGWSACPGYVDGYEIGYELIPEFSSDALPFRTGAESGLRPDRAGSGEGGALKPERSPAPGNFAC